MAGTEWLTCVFLLLLLLLSPSSIVMAPGARFLLLLSCLLSVGLGADVAIVGGGIGGAAVGYYLKEFGGQFECVVFESRDYIGGRLKDVEIGGTLVEVGGDIWASVNLYMMEAAERLGIQENNSSESGNGLTGIWDGSSWLNIEALVVRHSLSLRRTLDETALFNSKLLENYALRDQSPPFDSISSFLGYASLNEYADGTRVPFPFHLHLHLHLLNCSLSKNTHTEMGV